MNEFVMNKDNITNNINVGKDLLLETFLDEKIITQEQYNQMIDYAVIVQNENIFGRILSSFFSKKNKNDSGLKFIIVKIF